MLTWGRIGPATWAEPARALPLRWGSYDGRLAAAIALTVSGAVAIPSGNTFAFFQIVLGIAAFVVGWCILPARVGRRIAGLLPAFLGVAALLIGAQGIPVLVLPFLAWLFVRERPPASYLAAIPFVALSVALATRFAGFDYMVIALGIGAAIFVGCAWLAAALGTRFPARMRRPVSLPH
jgi:hypothetical protein